MNPTLGRALTAGLLLGWAPALAAQSELPADYNALRTPASPAFVLLGVEPTSVSRPNTPADFAASVLSATSNLSGLPKDFALETSPYWLFRHRRDGWRDDIRRSLLQSVARTFTVSVATAELGTTAQPVQGLGLSGRFSLLSGRLPDSSVHQIESLEQALAASAAQDLADLTPLFDAALQRALASARTQADSQQALDRLDQMKLEIIRAESEKGQIGRDSRALSGRAEKIATARTGFLVDLAGGAAWRAPGAAIDSASLDRWGVWLNASYTMPELSFVALGRYLGYRGSADAFDIGGRFVYTRDRYAVSAEYVGRHFRGGGGSDQWRLAGVLDYRVTSTLWLTGTFGRSFEGQAPGSLLAQLGLSLDLSRERYQFGSAAAP